MLFNTIQFAYFLPVVFFAYWIFKNKISVQNIILLIASYYFYSCWDYRFVFLLIFSTLLDYFSGIQIEKSISSKARKTWFYISIGINLGFLGIFKYYNFFVESFQRAFDSLGISFDVWTLNVILPVGISFYTFHGLSYVIDIYKNRINAEKNFIDYSLFVSYFPLLVAGPIERATHLLPQLKQKRIFNYGTAVDGVKQILWGLFKKVVIADTCSTFVNDIFANQGELSGSTLAIGAILFAFQIYGDFSGYSDIAQGTSRLFGIELLRNFSFPYFSRNIAEFWRRWHISLSSWFRDYLYIPLGGSKGNNLQKIRNTFIIFIVSGFWHGANWTFIIWGFLNALYILPSIILKTNRTNLETIAQGKLFPTLKEFFQMTITFGLTVFAWIFFRASSVSQAFQYIQNLFQTSIFKSPEIWPKYLIPYLIVFIIIEWLGREKKYAVESLFNRFPLIIRWSCYLWIAYTIFYFNAEEQQFIYFQF